jgi:hypothetical protein
MRKSANVRAVAIAVCVMFCSTAIPIPDSRIEKPGGVHRLHPDAVKALLANDPQLAARMMPPAGFKVVGDPIVLVPDRPASWWDTLRTVVGAADFYVDGGMAMIQPMDDGDPNTVEMAAYARTYEGTVLWGNVQFNEWDFWTWGEGLNVRNETDRPLLDMARAALGEATVEARPDCFGGGYQRSVFRDSFGAAFQGFIASIPGCTLAGPGVAECIILTTGYTFAAALIWNGWAVRRQCLEVIG